MHRHGKLTRVPFGIRIFAFLWDYLIIAGYMILLVGISIPLRPLLHPLFTTNPLLAEMNGFLFLTLPVFLYFWLSEGSKAHATWGKRKMGIVVAGMNGRAIGFSASLVRSGLKFLPWELAHFTIWHMVIPNSFPDFVIYSLLAAVYGLILIYLVSAWLSRNKQTGYDYCAKTVIRYRDSDVDTGKSVH